VAAALVFIFGAIGVLVAKYPRYWEQPLAAAPPHSSSPSPGDVSNASSSVPPAPLVVLEYTDYECPFCARMHEQLRSVTHRPDVRLVRRHFPLDGTCNPGLGPGIHPSACALARAAICAEAQDLLDPMEEGLFANQREKLSVSVLAARAGLDVPRFEACLTSKDTERRLAADIAAAWRDGVRATPSYVVGGAVHAGRFPAELLPPLGVAHGG
jgi:protein-disulfide isomerase